VIFYLVPKRLTNPDTVSTEDLFNSNLSLLKICAFFNVTLDMKTNIVLKKNKRRIKV
jgi:hypothetical protein